MPITNDIDVTDNLIVNFGKRRDNVIFSVEIVNTGKRSAKIKKISSSLDCVSVLNFNESNSVIKAGNQMSYLFEAAYRQQQQSSVDQSEGKIRFTFRDRTHITRSIKIMNEPNERKTADSKPTEQTVQPQKSALTPGLINLQGFIKKNFSDWLKELDGMAPAPIDISDGLLIEFDHFHCSKVCVIQIRNNTWQQWCLTSIGMDQSKITMCDDIDGQLFIGPRRDLQLHFKAKFFHDKPADKTQIAFWFGKKCIRRTIKIQYGVRGPIIPKANYEIPAALNDLIVSRYRISRSQYLDALDDWVPPVHVDYAKHFHNLLYLEECGLREEFKTKYLQKEAFFGDQKYFMENGNTIREKYASGIYDLKIKDLFEIRPSLQMGMRSNRF